MLTRKPLAELETEPNSEFFTSALITWMNIFLHANTTAMVGQCHVPAAGHKNAGGDCQRTPNTSLSGLANV